MGLLDNFGEFIKTPEGMGLLSAVAGGLAGANRGTPINNLGRAGLAGVMGYSQAQNRLSDAADKEVMRKLQQAQFDLSKQNYDLNAKKLTMPDYKVVGNQVVQFGDDGVKPVYTAPADPNKMSRKEELDYMSQLRKDEREFAAKLAAGNKPAAQPYFQFIATPNGIVKADARSGNMAYGDINGAPVVKSADSPELQGKIAEAEKLGAETGKQKSLMQGKEDALASVKEANKMLNQGIYSGAYANLKMKGAKYTPGVSTDTAARTEEFMAYIGNTVVPRLQEFGGNDSNEELRYLRGIMGGEITMEEKALKKILADSERKIQAGINRLKMQPKDRRDNNDPLGLR